MADERTISMLKKKRGIIKSQLSKFTTYIDRFNDSRNLTELTARLEKAEDLWADFDKIQTEIELEDDTETQSEHRDAFETAYFNVIGRARQLKHAGSQQASSDVQPQANHTCANQNVNLPILKLPEFNGEYSKWIQFNDTFNAIIHNNNTLNITQKFYYLKSCLSGEAAQALDTLEVSDANYEVARDILRQRFENKNIIIHSHVRALFELSQVIKDSHTSLRSLIDSMSQHLRALRSLGQPVDEWDSMIIFLITSKLDTITRREWEKATVKHSELPTTNSFKAFLNERCQFLEKLARDDKQTNKQIGNKENKDKTRLGTLTCLASNLAKCLFCKGSHNIYSCKDLLNLSVDKRLTQVKKLKLCTNCLRSNHFSRDCKAGGCKKCSGRHNTLLHFSDSKGENERDDHSTANTNSENSVKESAVATHALQINNNSYILLATARIVIFDNNGKPHQCRALLDNGSQSNFVTKRLSQKLGVAGTPIKLPVCGINQSVTTISHKINASVKSFYNDYRAELSFLVVENITQELPNKFYNISTLNIPDDLSLADPRFNYPDRIDLLLGAGIFWELLCAGQIQLGKGRPFLQKTRLGWVISGPMAPMCKETVSLCQVSTIQEVRDNLERFWEIEECFTAPKYTREESECEALFVKTAERDEQGRFTVQLPFRTNVNELGDSLNMTIKRFYALERRLAKDPDLKKQYLNFMNEYQQLGHMTEITPEEKDLNSVYYLPHHSVVKESSTTTRVRVVFDASARTSSNLSLNDVLMTGPIIQDSLFAILVRFRVHKYVFTADVRKMYRQVNVYEPHRNYQRIIWRPNEREPVRHFKLNTLTYGTASASFEAIRALHQTAIDKRDAYPEACNIILMDFYVDDLISGSDTIKSAKDLVHNINTVLSSGCFQLHKWNSNNEKIIESLQAEPSTDQIQLPQEVNSKTLGLSWNTSNDTLHYQASNISNKSTKVTKRKILSFIAQLFDPLGLISPTIVIGKIIMQKIWKAGIGWDESLPLEIFTIWNQFFEGMKNMNEISIPRCAWGQRYHSVQLHGFSDASEVAYGACIYVRSEDEAGNITSKILCAKSRVAPLKTVSLPRLELCGALLLARLHQQVVEALSRLDSQHCDSFYWCDSTIVLSWVTTEPSRLKTFVANRTAEIQRLTDVNRWSHVVSDENPADIITRGMSLGKLATTRLWWHGPPWLKLKSEAWPIVNTVPQTTVLPELKDNEVVCTTVKFSCDLFHRFSSYMKLLRVTAYCLRFIKNVRGRQKCTGLLSVNELNESLFTLVRMMQSMHFAPEINDLERKETIRANSRILSLNPFLDEHRILRVGGRLRYSELPYERRHPMLLPSNHSRA
ncbi:uncharacterized protein LOC118644996 [Monomorium pharaonis]|uniref:uncharacterized protein LOC118644996 n=1 Tax=Monomorium pharaonis TaxID=307658 RepID=UPI001747C8DD|nr:uncharacterized protein LOC118644996 [Monomorium pharaonis]